MRAARRTVARVDGIKRRLRAFIASENTTALVLSSRRRRRLSLSSADRVDLRAGRHCCPRPTLTITSILVVM